MIAIDTKEISAAAQCKLVPAALFAALAWSSLVAATVYAQSPAGSWTMKAPLPTPRSGIASASYRGLILVLGGELLPDRTFPENADYDSKTGTWTTLTAMPHGRHGFRSGVIGDNAYSVGGNLAPGGGETTDQLLMFHLP
jgi:N-acetylneuraminic acid mutarotase